MSNDKPPTWSTEDRTSEEQPSSEETPSDDPDRSDVEESGSRERTSPERSVSIDRDEAKRDESTGLFDDLLGDESIFDSKELLRPSHTPDELPHRDEQISQLATIVGGALRGETPSNILVYGKTGTGKTACAKYVGQELEQTSQTHGVPCHVEYINCEVTDTQYRVLATLANTLIERNKTFITNQIEELRELRSKAVHDPAVLEERGKGYGSVSEVEARIEELEEIEAEQEPVAMTGLPTDRVYNVFFEAVDLRDRVAVIMLDEVDKLVENSGDDTLYNLSRMNGDLEHARVSVLGISNDLQFTERLDPRVKSSLGEEEVVFPPYDANQLRDILRQRASKAFNSGVLTDDVIPLCGAFAAQEHGDARRALDLLRTAGELAERSETNQVQEQHVRQAQEKLEVDRIVETIRTLPLQSQLVLFAVVTLEKAGAEKLTTGEVYNTYEQVCEEVETNVLTQRRVTELINELDMLGLVNARVVSKGRYGRTKEISLSVPIEETEKVIRSTSRVNDLERIEASTQTRIT